MRVARVKRSLDLKKEKSFSIRSARLLGQRRRRCYSCSCYYRSKPTAAAAAAAAVWDMVGLGTLLLFFSSCWATYTRARSLPASHKKRNEEEEKVLEEEKRVQDVQLMED